MRIAIISGVCVEHDAISNAMRDQWEVLGAAGHDARLFAHHAVGPHAQMVEILGSPWRLAAHPFYATADLAIFHFGVHYQMFNALLLNGGPRKVVHFHNVTPPEILSGAGKALSESSLRQLSIAEFADEVWSDSPHNTEVLLAHTDVPLDRVHLMQLMVPGAEQPLEARFAAPDEPVRVLTVGRFVEAKGLVDLVEAVGRVDADVGPVQLVLAGSTTFSSPAFLGRLRDAVCHLPEHVEATVLESPADPELLALYRSACVFVSASRHEGFCVPVIEALAAGCRVVTTDAGALPDTVGPCGEVAAVGDIGALAAALTRAVADSRSDWHQVPAAACVAHLSRFGRDEYRSRLLQAVERVCPAPPGG